MAACAKSGSPTDNASMIAAAGSQMFERGMRAGLDLAVDPGLPLS